MVITTLVDDVYDGLLAGTGHIMRVPLNAGIVQTPRFETEATAVGLRAEHGFAALVSVPRGSTITTVLFDTGLSPDVIATSGPDGRAARFVQS